MLTYQLKMSTYKVRVKCLLTQPAEDMFAHHQVGFRVTFCQGTGIVQLVAFGSLNNLNKL